MNINFHNKRIYSKHDGVQIKSFNGINNPAAAAAHTKSTTHALVRSAHNIATFLIKTIFGYSPPVFFFLPCLCVVCVATTDEANILFLLAEILYSSSLTRILSLSTICMRRRPVVAPLHYIHIYEYMR